jgi:hypothetical protein
MNKLHKFAHSLLMILLFHGLASAQERIDQDKNHETSLQAAHDENQDKKEYYAILGISEQATCDEVAYAYYKKVDQENWTIADLKKGLSNSYFNSQVLLQKDFKNETDDDVKIVIYGTEREQYVRTYVGYGSNFSGIYYRDEYGRTYTKQTITNIENPEDYQKPILQEIVTHQELIEKSRKAYELLTGRTIEKIKITKNKDFDLAGLNKNRIYDYLKRSNANLQDLQKIIRDERLQNGIPEKDETYFVFGENNQDMSLLSDEDKIKAQACLEERLEKERPRRYCENGLALAIMGGTITVVSLIARAIFLKD